MNTQLTMSGQDTIPVNDIEPVGCKIRMDKVKHHTTYNQP